MLRKIVDVVKSAFDIVGRLFRLTAMLLVAFPAKAFIDAIKTAPYLFLVAFGRLFVPSGIRAAATAASPLIATITPGVLAATIVANDDGETSAERNVGVIGAAATLTLASRSAQYTPQLASIINGPANFAWLAITAAVAGVGTSLGVRVARGFSPEN